MAARLRHLVRDMRRRAPKPLTTRTEHIAIIPDVTMFCVALHTRKLARFRAVGFERWLRHQRCRRREGRGVTLHFLPVREEDAAKFPPSGRGEEEPRLPRILRSRSHGTVKCRQVAGPMQWPLAEGSGSPLPSFPEGGKKKELALPPS